MAAVRILLGIICLVGIHGSGLLGSNSLAGNRNKEQGVRIEDLRWQVGTAKHSFLASTLLRQQLIETAIKQIGVRETSGKNDGTMVETYLRYTGNRKGEPWCASFVSWVFAQVGLDQPRTAWSPSLFPTQRLVKTGSEGSVFGIYFTNLKRIAHCGLIEKVDGSWLVTIEGNTNVEGGREGDGVYRKRRHIKTIKYLADWLTKKGEEVQ